MALETRENTLAQSTTFSRASKAWEYNSAGVFTEFAVNAIREAFDPGDSNARQGIALEGASTNLWPNSEDASAGTYSNVGVTLGTPKTFANNISLDEVVEDTSTGFHYIGDIISVTSGAIATYSVHLDSSALTTAVLRIGSGGDYATATFDLSAGTISSAATVNGTATDADASIVDMGGGVYRCSITGAVPSTSSYYGRVFLNRSGLSYTGDGSSSLYAGAHQFEELPFASSYIPTVASQITRAQENADVASLEPWYRSGGYGFELEAKLRYANGAGIASQVLSITDGTFDNRLAVQAQASVTRLLISKGGSLTIVNVTATTDYTRFRVAVRMSSGDSAISIGGGAAVANASSAPPPATAVKLGRSANNTNPIYGWLRDFKFVTDPVLIASDYTDAELANRSAEYAS